MEGDSEYGEEDEVQQNYSYQEPVHEVNTEDERTSDEEPGSGLDEDGKVMGQQQQQQPQIVYNQMGAGEEDDDEDDEEEK